MGPSASQHRADCGPRETFFPIRPSLLASAKAACDLASSRLATGNFHACHDHATDKVVASNVASNVASDNASRISNRRRQKPDTAVAKQHVVASKTDVEATNRDSFSHAGQRDAAQAACARQDICNEQSSDAPALFRMSTYPRTNPVPGRIQVGLGHVRLTPVRDSS